MSIDYGKFNLERGVVLAPMEGITDLPFRIICREMGADIVYSEFIASEALIRDAKKSFMKMDMVDEERPVAVQIFGSRIDAMVDAAKIVEQSGADILDLNFGCWVRKVVNHDSGAAFTKNPEKMAELTKAVVDAVSIPVTAKTRLGWSQSSINIFETAKRMEQTGIRALAVHCRTREQAMQGSADWSYVAKLKEQVSLPIILNGDVRTAKEAKKAFDETSCDAVMIGRAAVGNPFLFKQVKQYLSDGIENPEVTVDERVNLCLRHLQLSIKYKGFPKGLYEFRKHYSGYLKGLYGASNVRQKLVLMETYEEIEAALLEYTEYVNKINIENSSNESKPMQEQI